MRKFFFIIMISLFLIGCSCPVMQQNTFYKDCDDMKSSLSRSWSQSDVMKHDTMYKNWDHMKYSWSCQCEPVYTKLSKQQGWWGITVKECQQKVK